jgi:hypothetical protein
LSAPGLQEVVQKEAVFRGYMERKTKVFEWKLRNYDLAFVPAIKAPATVSPLELRTSIAVLDCLIYGRFKFSKRQLDHVAARLGSSPKRLAISLSGRHFKRQDLHRFLVRELETRGCRIDEDAPSEIWLFVIDQNYYLGEPLFKSENLSDRDERLEEREGSLPPSIAAAMVFSSHIREHEVVVDPVCGSGTVLREVVAFAPQAQVHGFDIESRAVKIAQSNLQKQKQVQLRQLDSTQKWPLPEKVSLMLANLPFGKQYGSTATNFELYRNLLSQAQASAVADGFRAVLLTSDRDSLGQLRQTLRHDQWIKLFQVKVKGEWAEAWRFTPVSV